LHTLLSQPDKIASPPATINADSNRRYFDLFIFPSYLR